MNADARLTELVVAYHAAADAGTPTTPEELCRDCPELLDRLRVALSGTTFRFDPDATCPPNPNATEPPTFRVLTESPTERLPNDVPGYAIERVLGRGGMGVVYLAWQTKLKRQVALKMIRGGPGASSAELARFRAEAEAVARLQHPNIVQVFEVGETASNPFLTMEYVAGGSLADKVAAGPLTPKAAAAVVETLARAVQHDHDRGVIHRDLKPVNVLIAVDGTPKVTDFGLAKRTDETADDLRTRTGVVMGTPAYMAPEQASGGSRDAGERADVYALGVILYECLTGKRPFAADSVMELLKRVMEGNPASPRTLVARLPRDIETVCLTAMAKSPADRYPTATAFADDLRRFIKGESVTARPPGVWRKVVGWGRRNVATVAVVVSLAVSLVAVAYAATRPHQVTDSETNRQINPEQPSDSERQTDATIELLDGVIAAPRWGVGVLESLQSTPYSPVREAAIEDGKLDNNSRTIQGDAREHLDRPQRIRIADLWWEAAMKQRGISDRHRAFLAARAADHYRYGIDELVDSRRETVFRRAATYYGPPDTSALHPVFWATTVPLAVNEGLVSAEQRLVIIRPPCVVSVTGTIAPATDGRCWVSLARGRSETAVLIGSCEPGDHMRIERIDRDFSDGWRPERSFRHRLLRCHGETNTVTWVVRRSQSDVYLDGLLVGSVSLDFGLKDDATPVELRIRVEGANPLSRPISWWSNIRVWEGDTKSTDERIADLVQRGVFPAE